MFLEKISFLIGLIVLLGMSDADGPYGIPRYGLGGETFQMNGQPGYLGPVNKPGYAKGNGFNPYNVPLVGGYPAPNGYPGPNGGYPGPNRGYPGPNRGYPGPNGGYPGPGRGYPGPPGPNGGYPGPNGGYPGPNGGYPGPNGGYPGGGYFIPPQKPQPFPAGYGGPSEEEEYKFMNWRNNPIIYIPQNHTYINDYTYQLPSSYDPPKEDKPRPGFFRRLGGYGYSILKKGLSFLG
ncbi:hypothetical protein K493DRAFT_373886 [Basidiobolus meristosporus CBS 931.73]|uniref:Rhodopsin n=1 Tax=Basidiobolus meristosporus CBS 931.73 TaxID=1314790 RepID=A0A1Y1Y8G3_9FUNG|nr:hypothetical protein K493DRAFT_373886 [Basidiobolus meristosporus CBS 931.73]|eukprot:ORX94310.1 hypothetical protein K493DRAFT_373886 [Basidiobolus meristosporus CBS 931.73]